MKTNYTDTEKQQVIEAALQSIATGQSLNAFCKANNYPYMTVSNWIRDPLVNSLREGAVITGSHYLAGEAMDIIDDAAGRAEKIGDGPLGSVIMNAAKARADIRMRLIGQWNRRDYGDKQRVEVGGIDGAPIKTESRVDVSSLSPDQLRALASVKLHSDS